MTRINAGSVLAGGLAAGLVIAALNFVTNNYLLASDWQHVMQARQVVLAEVGTTGALVVAVAADLLTGFLVVFLYAAVRPRFGPGPATATLASAVVFAAAALVVATFAGTFFSWDLYIRASALAFVALLAGGLVGARLYREEAPEPAPDEF